MAHDQWTRRQVLGTAFGAAGLGMIGVLSGCGGGDDDDDRASSETTGLATTTAAQRGGVLRVAMVGGGATDSLDPNKLLNSVDFARTLSLYESLTFRDHQWNPSMLLAESVEPGAAADRWTVRVRDGVTFHDGKALTADDVLFSFERSLNPDAPGLGFALLGEVVDLTKIVKVDDRTLEFTLLRPFSVLPAMLGLGVTIVPVGFDPAKPIGTGPWKFVSFAPGDRSVFERYDGYWDGPAIADRLEIINFSDATAAANAIQAQQVDVIAGVGYAEKTTLEASGIKVLRTQSNSWTPFVMNTAIAPFDDPKVREAMRLIVDREQMVQQVLSGNGRVGNDLYSPLDPAYLASVPQRSQDIERAKQLLAEAGQENLTLDLASVPTDPAIPAMVQVFAEQAKAAGVTINIQNMTPDQFFSTVYFQAPLQPDFWANESYVLDSSLFQVGGGPYNSGNFDDAEFDELLEQALGELDEGKRNELFGQMQQIQYDRGNFILWGFADGFDAYAPNVSGLIDGTRSVFGLNDFDLHRVGLG